MVINDSELAVRQKLEKHAALVESQRIEELI